MLSPTTARIVRKLAKYNGLTLDQLMQKMLQVCVPQLYPDFELVFGDSPK